MGLLFALILHAGAPVILSPHIRPWSPAWQQACKNRYRSFDPRTGYWKDYGGKQHPCSFK